ncbi:PREDICTED: uncharacterized protein LOC108770847 [Trachymyrmex cornetzi]|uniref:uncharacterized protein LOC108770847 n=1 Tax=Trachymyrmex cornetzi TaxID=471704 RepID=UPI00084F2795|nr:PREDICTED: uncharacterized protein LOC108770847 [Trachymyrmex cornetzi]
MEKLKKTRKALRAAFTRAFSRLNQLIEEENVDTVELQSMFEVFKGKVCELDELDQQIFQRMQDAEEITEEVLSEEIENADEYRIKYQRMKLRVSRIVEAPLLHTRSNESLNVITTPPHTQDKRFKLPKIELQKFSGDLKEWLKFWSLFKNIHEDGSLSKGDKFQYLVQAIVEGSKASELINSFPPIAENYDKAIDRLRDRYGKSDLLIEVYVRELLKLVLNTVKVGSKISMASLYDKLETQLRALESLNVTTEMCAAMLYPLVESALPEDLLRVWQRNTTSTGTDDAKDRLSGLMDFLQKEVTAEERIAMAVQRFDDKAVFKEIKESKGKQKLQSNKVASASGLINAKPLQGVECIFCSEKHDSSSCIKAKTMSLEERQKIARNMNACFNCLKLGHSFRRCRYKESCPWCRRQHVLLMCRNISSNLKSKEPDEIRSEIEDKVEGQNLASLSKEPEVFLQTLRVCLVNAGVKLQVRALINTGSHYSYISERVAKKLRYEPMGKRTMIHLLFGGTQTRPQEHQYYNVHLRSLDGSCDYEFMAYQQDTICADVAGKIYTGRIVNLKCGVTAIETRLGWTLLGRAPRFKKKESDTVLTVLSMYVQDADITDLWNLDVIGIEDPIRKSTKEEHLQEVLCRFYDTIKIEETGRYEVFLPWKENHPPLSENRETAKRRLGNTIIKLRNDGLLHEYEKVFNEWLEEGIIEEVPTEELSHPGHYLPHRHVVKENSTTPIRPVFDASATEKGKVSLNQCLEAGLNFIELIPTLLLRFREKRIGAIMDIRRAFLQISITPKERDYVRFLWQRTSDDKIVTYRHCRVVFGITSSPFLLGTTLDYHMKQVLERTSDEQTKSIIERLGKSMYVDNCVTSVETEEEMNSFRAIAICHELRRV